MKGKIEKLENYSETSKPLNLTENQEGYKKSQQYYQWNLNNMYRTHHPTITENTLFSNSFEYMSR